MPPPAPPPRRLDWLAAALSYLLPGLGQVLQGRVGKGLLFFVALYALFFYGMSLGKFKNVWLPDATHRPDITVLGQKLGGVPKAVAYRPQFMGQFWIGVAAWPAVLQYAHAEPRTDFDDELKPTGVTVTTLCPGPTESEFKVRAGSQRSRLFQAFVMKAEPVARVGYDAMMSGKPVAVPGLRNKLIPVATRIIPRSMLARASHRAARPVEE